jgi:hypothetical protein
MAIGVVFEFRGATHKQYEHTVKKALKGQRNKVADWPVKGCLAHIPGPMPGGWRVVDVWQSKAAFNRFGKIIVPLGKEAGMKLPKPKIFKLARFIKD